MLPDLGNYKAVFYHSNAHLSAKSRDEDAGFACVHKQSKEWVKIMQAVPRTSLRSSAAMRILVVVQRW